MLSYELAKQLKDAGFARGKEKCSNCIGDYGLACSEDIFPTLSELIAACGDEFYELTLSNVGFKQWEALGGTRDDGNWNFCSRSENSPEEAVANLWLALNKNNGK